MKHPRLSDRKQKTSQRLRVPPSKVRTDAHSSPSDSDSEDDESEVFNPALEQEDRDEFRMDVPRPVGKYVNRHFRKGLTMEELTAMLKKHPKIGQGARGASGVGRISERGDIIRA